MNEDFEKIEEELKKKNEQKKEQKKSGKSVFKLQEIIKKKSQGSQSIENKDEKER